MPAQPSERDIPRPLVLETVPLELQQSLLTHCCRGKSIVSSDSDITSDADRVDTLKIIQPDTLDMRVLQGKYFPIYIVGPKETLEKTTIKPTKGNFDYDLTSPLPQGGTVTYSWRDHPGQLEHLYGLFVGPKKPEGGYPTSGFYETNFEIGTRSSDRGEIVVKYFYSPAQMAFLFIQSAIKVKGLGVHCLMIDEETRGFEKK